MEVHDAVAGWCGDAGVSAGSPPQTAAVKACIVDGCGRRPKARGMCAAHYDVAYRRGVHVEQPRMHLPVAEQPANPWAGRLVCPDCGSSDWTMPYAPGDPNWRCVACRRWAAGPIRDAELEAGAA